MKSMIACSASLCALFAVYSLLFEHFTAVALVAGTFAIGYGLSLIRLLLLAFVFFLAIAFVDAANKLTSAQRRRARVEN